MAEALLLCASGFDCSSRAVGRKSKTNSQCRTNQQTIINSQPESNLQSNTNSPSKSKSQTKSKSNFISTHFKEKNNYAKSEAEIINVLQDADKNRVYLDYECKSLHAYAVKFMRFTDPVASSFITIDRKAFEVPALKAAIVSGGLQVQKARKITSVLNAENHKYWIELATQSSQKVVENEVARANPESEKPERIKYVKVNLRDQHQCTHQDENGMRCEQRRWLQIHHIVQVSEGGQNTIDNLTTLCSGHHKLTHHRDEFLFDPTTTPN